MISCWLACKSWKRNPSYILSWNKVENSRYIDTLPIPPIIAHISLFSNHFLEIRDESFQTVHPHNKEKFERCHEKDADTARIFVENIKQIYTTLKQGKWDLMQKIPIMDQKPCLGHEGKIHCEEEATTDGGNNGSFCPKSGKCVAYERKAGFQ